MAKITVFLFLLVALVVVSAAEASPEPLPARRSRFLLTSSSFYSCSKKSAAAVCLAVGSPGATCCGGRCVDTGASGEHCGGCNKACKHRAELLRRAVRGPAVRQGQLRQLLQPVQQQVHLRLLRLRLVDDPLNLSEIYHLSIIYR
ncbi:hypothetical protein OsJ_17859 [Oryza sativa Japonica Group]|uniref:Uncharacterized protein n=1 Tax=Oryza sativa subsp. japonica TaxID=39947 RepID=B9FJT9_ORYSJ|nr:hypothetical protein OsJ_17859 [Oryza sativa Japonica Group]